MLQFNHVGDMHMYVYVFCMLECCVHVYLNPFLLDALHSLFSSSLSPSPFYHDYMCDHIHAFDRRPHFLGNTFF